MKKTKQIIALLLCLVMVVAGSVFATVAYLTAQESVLNTFTVGNVDIKLDETVVNPDGTVTNPDDKTEEGNKYHLIPGQTYVKDPTVTVIKESEASYVRMRVTINCMSALKEIFGDDFLPQDFVAGWDPAVWETTGIILEDADMATYEFRYYETVSTIGAEEDLKLDPLFDSFTLPSTVNNEQLAKLDTLQISVLGEAIQAATFNTADEAWAAFDAQYANP